jgi:hypothetical protein
MILVLVVIAVMAILLVLAKTGILPASTLGSDLEEYIVSRRPVHAGDVERLSREYIQHSQRRFI